MGHSQWAWEICLWRLWVKKCKPGKRAPFGSWKVISLLAGDPEEKWSTLVVTLILQGLVQHRAKGASYILEEATCNYIAFMLFYDSLKYCNVFLIMNTYLQVLKRVTEFEIKNENPINRSNQFFFLKTLCWSAVQIILFLFFANLLIKFPLLSLSSTLSIITFFQLSLTTFPKPTTQNYFLVFVFKGDWSKCTSQCSWDHVWFQVEYSRTNYMPNPGLIKLGVSWYPMGWEDIVSVLKMLTFRETKPACSLYQEGNSFPINPQSTIPQVAPGL